MTKMFCDLCEKEVPILYHYTVPGYSQAKITSHETTIMTYALPSSLQIEICEKCQEKIREKLHIYK